MFYTHEDIEMARQQIQHAEGLITNHQRIIDRLRESGQSTRIADRLMEKMRIGLVVRQRHLTEIEAQIDGSNQYAGAQS